MGRQAAMDRQAAMNDKTLGIIGLATRARKLVSGWNVCEAAVKKGDAKLVIVAGDAAENTKARFCRSAKNKGIEYRIFGTCSGLGRYTGKGDRAVLAVTDAGFAKRLIEIIDMT